MNRHHRGWLLVWGLATLALIGVHLLIRTPTGLVAEYFDGIHWTAPRGSLVDSEPSTDVLKHHRPNFEGDSFSVEWRGFIFVPVSGTYTFATTSDDGSWLYVHGREVVDNGGRHRPQERRGTIALDAGVHSIFVRYFQDKGDCVFDMSWARDGGTPDRIPGWALFPARVPYAQVLAARVTVAALVVAMAGWYLLLGGYLATWAVRFVDRPLGSVLLLSLLLNIWGIWWAMPNRRGWGPDELVPQDVVGALQSLFSNGWHDKYPPFHYAVLSLADLPVFVLSWLGIVDLDAMTAHGALMLIGRLVSLAFGAGTIVVIHRCGRQLYGSRGAAFAALTTALTVPFAYYGKMANLDVPYLFWFAVSLLAYIRILQRHARRDYLLFAAAAALAGCTKDQAWGLYVLTPVAIIVARVHLARRDGRPISHALLDTTVLLAIAIGLVTFVVADNVLFNLSGLVAHVRLLTTTPNQFHEFPRTLGGELELARRVIREMRYMFGWPLAIIVSIALVRAVAWRTTAPSLRWLLVPAVSYYVTFLAVILFFFDRYLLPITFVLALLTGYWLERFVAPGVRALRWRMAFVAAAFAYSVAYVFSIDYAMTVDSRYTATRWLSAHVDAEQTIGSMGPLEYAAIENAFRWQPVEYIDDVDRIRPDFIVLDADLMPDMPPWVRSMRRSLLQGHGGYRLAFRYRAAPLPLPGAHPDLGAAPRHGPEFSDLSMINPTIEVFERGATSPRP